MSKTLFFGNLPWSVTSEDLTRLVSEHAEVLSARVITDRETGRSRGFGFVEVPDEAAEAVISAFNGYQLEGRPLTVNEAQPRPDRAGGAGGNRGRGPADRRGFGRRF